jgi:lysophospholipid acyltransferase (LPLAT)-like uncharacterized protein
VKKLVRTRLVQSALAWLVSVYLRATLASIRWRYENRAIADAAAVAPEGALACFWHGRIALAPATRPLFRAKPRRVLISNSPDGNFVAKIVARMGFPAIRGSSTLDNRKARRSVQAFRDAVGFIDGGGIVVVTPDGPRGPAQKMPEGPVMLARTRGTPVILAGFAARPTITLRSWDRTQIPLPFGRGCIVFDGPFVVPHEAEPAVVEAARRDWEARLTAVQDRAEALLAA